ncbi:anti-sigma-K factor rskA [Nonomuraea polychroma]|uniref:Regulator of SigK n=1 Tax=Nonomuraea polychroma TaxID=46176 RepID=A0A438M2W2_9ACTN|nr:anti-sigma factor [Nonomuraea polychroma]RVX40166.1 anti-sigma-K factor rskA [Nonomuraea polychroma]
MNDEPHTLSGAYAVHALPYAEWVLFEEHLRACQVCGAEVRRLREAAARLAETVAESPPDRLRSRLLAAAHESRARSEGGVPDDSPTIWRRPETRGSGAAPADAPTLALPPGHPARSAGGGPAGRGPESGGPESRRNVVPLRRKRSKVVAGLVAMSAAAAVALGAVAFDARRDLGELTARNGELVAVLAAPDAETLRRPVTSGGTATVVISRSKGRMVFTSSDLRKLPDTQAYELWLMGPGGPRRAGMLGPAEDGVTAPMMITPLRDDDRVAITVEPASGSEKPTTQPIMLAELPEA